MIGLYLTHPQVMVDPAVPVPDWGLSAQGRARLAAVLGSRWLARTGRIVASPERKAREAAAILAGLAGLPVEIAAGSGENNRSATGFLAPPQFEAAADRFFAEPETSWRGWERACDASDRIRRAVERVLEGHPARTPLLLVGHGAVGTLLKCSFAGRPIGRSEDQPAGGGNIFAFRLEDRKLVRDWTPMEDFDAGTS